MRQRVVLAPRNAGEVMAVAVSVTLLLASVVAVFQDARTTRSDTASGSQLASEWNGPWTSSEPGLHLANLQQAAVGSRMPRVPTFVQPPPPALCAHVPVAPAPVAVRSIEPGVSPSAAATTSQALVEALAGPRRRQPSPSGFSITRDLWIASPTSAPSSSAPTDSGATQVTEPTTSQAPGMKKPTPSLPAEPTDPPTTDPPPTDPPTDPPTQPPPTDPPATDPPTTGPVAPPTTAPAPDPLPDPSLPPSPGPTAEPGSGTQSGPTTSPGSITPGSEGSGFAPAAPTGPVGGGSPLDAPRD